LGKLISLIPIGTVAFRFNLFSAVCVALTAGVVAVISGQWSVVSGQWSVNEVTWWHRRLACAKCRVRFTHQ